LKTCIKVHQCLGYDCEYQIRCFYTFFIFSFCTGYSEFGYHLNKTGRAMVYSCSWPVYQTYAGLQVSRRHTACYIVYLVNITSIYTFIISEVPNSFRRDRASKNIFVLFHQSSLACYAKSDNDIINNL